jgi:methionyl aminopeptidase
MVRPGVTTLEMDRAAEALIRSRSAKPAFKGYRGYPATVCISIENEIVHGIPGKRVLNEGEIVSIDVGAIHRGYVGDAAITVACGAVDKDRLRLMEATDLALSRAIRAARAGNFLREVSVSVDRTCKDAGFSVVRDFVGHGVGTSLHEEPQVVNFDPGEPGPMLRTGMVLAIEPMVNMGSHRVRVLKDKWTAVTADGRPSAHFEHSVVVREYGGEILSQGIHRKWGCRTD